MAPSDSLILPQIAEVTRLRKRLAYAYSTCDRLQETLGKLQAEYVEAGNNFSNLLIQINQVQAEADTALTNNQTIEYDFKARMIKDMRWMGEGYRIERIELVGKMEAVGRKIRGWEQDISEIIGIINVVRSRGVLGWCRGRRFASSLIKEGGKTTRYEVGFAPIMWGFLLSEG